jgi:hypothetical protein
MIIHAGRRLSAEQNAKRKLLQVFYDRVFMIFMKIGDGAPLWAKLRYLSACFSCTPILP